MARTTTLQKAYVYRYSSWPWPLSKCHGRRCALRREYRSAVLEHPADRQQGTSTSGPYIGDIALTKIRLRARNQIQARGPSQTILAHVWWWPKRVTRRRSAPSGTCTRAWRGASAPTVPVYSHGGRLRRSFNCNRVILKHAH